MYFKYYNLVIAKVYSNVLAFQKCIYVRIYNNKSKIFSCRSIVLCTHYSAKKKEKK